jgi:integrase
MVEQTSKQIKHSPWAVYMQVKDNKFYTHEEIQNLIIHSGKSLELKALCSLLYLTGARRSEILRYESRDAELKNNNMELTLNSIRVEDIQEFVLPYQDQLLPAVRICTRVLKSTRPSTKLKETKQKNFQEYLNKKYELKRDKLPTKVAIVFLNSEDGSLLQTIQNYVASTPRFWNKFGEIIPNTPLFLKNPSYYTKEIHKILGCSFHNIRVSRFRILLNERDYNVADIQLVGGWKDLSMPSRYVKSISAQIQQKELLHMLELGRI